MGFLRVELGKFVPLAVRNAVGELFEDATRTVRRGRADRPFRQRREFERRVGLLGRFRQLGEPVAGG
jgi:hypothetical protein